MRRINKATNWTHGEGWQPIGTNPRTVELTFCVGDNVNDQIELDVWMTQEQIDKLANGWLALGERLHFVGWKATGPFNFEQKADG
jgi:hypothetical protein